MTIEEKAKAYDAALERARKILNEILDNELLGFPDQIREIFPVLKEEEEEDEKIRKGLINIFDSALGQDFLQRKAGLDRDKVIAYLEKQRKLFESGSGLYYYDGEKTTYLGYPSTEDNPYDFAMSQQEKQEEQDKCPEYCVRSHCIGCSIYEKQKEQQEVDLEKFDKEVTKIWGRCAAHPNDTIACLCIDSFIEIAHHFYELGLNARKEE